MRSCKQWCVVLSLCFVTAVILFFLSGFFGLTSGLRQFNFVMLGPTVVLMVERFHIVRDSLYEAETRMNTVIFYMLLGVFLFNVFGTFYTIKYTSENALLQEHKEFLQQEKANMDKIQADIDVIKANLRPSATR